MRVKLADDVPAACAELQRLQRLRAQTIKSRVMLENRLVAAVAQELGYHAGLDEGQREKAYAAARARIAAAVKSGEPDFITDARLGIEAFERRQRGLEKEMLPLARALPVARWVNAPAQRGFGELSLAVVVGEAGDLANYANPAKLWRRLGCAPWQYRGATQMGCTWRARGGLPAEEWAAYGYSPRRRSIAYLIGEGLLKQNYLREASGESRLDTDRRCAAAPRRRKKAGEKGCETDRAAAGRRRGKGTGDSAGETDSSPAGPYRARYDEAKAKLKAAHAGDPDYPDLRCHRHGLLLATKLLLKNLWIEWRRAGGVSNSETDRRRAARPAPHEEVA